jgi:hypothetical protein
MSSKKITLPATYTMSAVTPWGMVVGGGAFGAYRLHSRSMIHNVTGVQCHDGDMPKYLEFQTTSQIPFGEPWSSPNDNPYMGSQANPFNLVIEKIKGTWTTSRGTAVMATCDIWIRRSAMRTRGQISRTRLTRLESVAHQRGMTYHG